jgi:hypothetical protein
LKDVFASSKGIRSIMQFGSISAPGNSDIDLIFVIDEDALVYQDVLHQFETQFSDSEKFLIYQHQPYFVAETIINKINIIRPCSNIRNIYGKEYQIQEDFGIYHDVYLLVELLTNYYPSYLTSFSHIRLNLQIINAFRYVFDIYQEVASHYGLSTSFAGEVNALLKKNNDMRRTEEVSSEDTRRFIEMSQKKLFDVVFEMFNQIDIMLGECLNGEGLTAGPMIYRGKIFSGKKKRLYVFKCLGRTFNLMHYPLNFYYLFGDTAGLSRELRESIEERNEHLYNYQKFCSNYTGGTFFYLPWWMTWKINTSNRIKTAILTVLSKLS